MMSFLLRAAVAAAWLVPTAIVAVVHYWFSFYVTCIFLAAMDALAGGGTDTGRIAQIVAIASTAWTLWRYPISRRIDRGHGP